MKTVLQINTVLNKGSVGRIVQGIGEVLIANGWKSYIAYARYAGKSNSHLIKIGNYSSVLCHALATRLTDRHGLFSMSSTRNLIMQIETIKPDIIHLHNLHGYYLNYAILFDYLFHSNIPVVWTLHDCWSFTGHCVYFDYCNCSKWKNGCFECPQINTYPSAYFDKSRSNYLNKKQAFTSIKNIKFVPVSHWLNGLLKQSFFKNYPSVMVHNGIDLSKFSLNNNLSFDELKGKFLLLGVANVWEKRKGLYDFIKLSHLLSQEFVIILIGLTKKQIKECPSNVIGISHTKDISELVSYYNRADIFLNLTYEDNFPTTNLEAIACGTPVITYNTGGSPESVFPDNGYVVEKGDINAIISCINKLRCNRALDTSMLRAYAQTHFDQNECFQEYLKIYNSLL